MTSLEQGTEGQPFSAELESWLKADAPKTLGGLGEVFGEKAFAVTVMLLMFVPALPLPTGGLSHAFEVITVIVSLQMAGGRRSLWLPRRWQGHELGPLTTGKAIPFMIRWIHRFERISRRRGTRVLELGIFKRLVALALAATAIIALLAPPFSGLDTLPGLAAVVMCLGLVLEDIVVVAIGAGLAAGAVAIIATVGAVVAHWIGQLAS